MSGPNTSLMPTEISADRNALPAAAQVASAEQLILIDGEPPASPTKPVLSWSALLADGQAARGDEGTVALQDKGSQVDVPRFDGVVTQGRHRREIDDGLGNVVSWVGLDAPLHLCGSAFVFTWADIHAIAAGFVGRFNDQFIQIFQNVFAMVLSHA